MTTYASRARRRTRKSSTRRGLAATKPLRCWMAPNARPRRATAARPSCSAAASPTTARARCSADWSAAERAGMAASGAQGYVTAPGELRERNVLVRLGHDDVVDADFQEDGGGCAVGFWTIRSFSHLLPRADSTVALFTPEPISRARFELKHRPMSSSHDDPPSRRSSSSRPLRLRRRAAAHGRMPDYSLAHPRRTWRGRGACRQRRRRGVRARLRLRGVAQLAGTFTDYGEVHAREWWPRATPRSGRRSRADASRPCNSAATFGGNTRSRCCSSSPTTSGASAPTRWVVSITCIATPVRGCSLPFAPGPAARRRGRPPPQPRWRVARAFHAGALRRSRRQFWMAQRRPAPSGLYRFRLDHRRRARPRALHRRP